MSLDFDQLFRKKLQKVPHFVKKHEKSSIWPNLYNFSNKLPCLGISMNFSGESCKKCLISWQRTRNHRSGQNLESFRTNYQVFIFRWTFQKKVSKSASFREKTQKTIHLAKTCNFSSKLPCVGIFMNFSERSCKKFLISWKSTRNHRFRQHYATFRTNYHVFAFRWTFKEKVGKSRSFREKAREIMDLVKTCNFSNKLPCFGVSMNFSAKGCKKWLNSRKSTKNHRFGQNLATFRTTTMSLDFDELFRRKLEKVPHFVKKHEKSSIWPNLYNFSNKLPCLCISMNFSGKSCKKCLISWKSTRNHRLSFLVESWVFLFFHFNPQFVSTRCLTPSRRRCHFIEKARRNTFPIYSQFNSLHHTLQNSTVRYENLIGAKYIITQLRNS